MLIKRNIYAAKIIRSIISFNFSDGIELEELQPASDLSGITSHDFSESSVVSTPLPLHSTPCSNPESQNHSILMDITNISNNTPLCDEVVATPQLHVGQENQDTSEINTSVRKRQRRPDTWKANVPKMARLNGSEYVSPKNGNVVPARQVLPTKSDHNRCKLLCRRNFDRADQEKILTEY